MSENYPFDREHWVVSVSFPVARLAEFEALEAKVAELAASRGGAMAGSSRPVPEFIGSTGCETFGYAVAFEAGDVNTAGFVRLVEEQLGAIVEHTPEIIYPPDEPEPAFRR